MSESNKLHTGELKTIFEIIDDIKDFEELDKTLGKIQEQLDGSHNVKMFSNFWTWINTKNEDDQTALTKALIDGNERLAEILAKYTISETYGLKTSDLHIAVNKNFKKVAELLIKNDDSTYRFDEDLNTPLHYALKNQSKELVELLIKNGAVTYFPNISAETPISIAEKMGPEWLQLINTKKQEFEKEREDNIKKQEFEKRTEDNIKKQEFEKEGEDNIKKCIDNLVKKNSKISREKAINLCSTLNGVLTTSDERNIPEKFDNLLNKWFRNNSIVEEILKTIRSDQLCFLHTIEYDKDARYFEIFTHLGKRTKFSKLDPIKYYNDEIKPCNSKLIAIPTGINSYKEKYGHATIVIIDRTGETDENGKQRIIIEHFDSSNFSHFRVKEFEAEIQILIQKMFGNQYSYEFIGQMEICPNNIQGKLRDTEYSGTCSQFQLWYAFKRLLEPDKSRKQVIKEMNDFLKMGVPGIIALIKSFQSLVNIKFSDSRLSRMNDFFFHSNKFIGKVNNRDFSHRYDYGKNDKIFSKKNKVAVSAGGTSKRKTKRLRKSLRKLRR